MDFIWKEFDSSGQDKGFTFVEGSQLYSGSSAPADCGEPEVLIRDEQRGMWVQMYQSVAMMSVDCGKTWFRFTPMVGFDSSGKLMRHGDKEMSLRVPAAQTRALQACWSPQNTSDQYINVINKSSTFAAGRLHSRKYLTSPATVRSDLPGVFPRVSFKLQSSTNREQEPSELDSLLFNHHVNLQRMYEFAWGVAERNITTPKPGSQVLHPFADAAFNDCLFMWDSIFMLEFWRWNPVRFSAQRGLDNFYHTQVDDGYIAREMTTAGAFRWHPSHPCGTGPNLFAWSELRHFAAVGDDTRVDAVLPHIAAYHRWTRANRSWQDGSYWNTGYGSGMDNQPRCPPTQTAAEEGGDTDFASHWHMSWVDATAQALLSAVSILSLLGGSSDTQGQKRSELIGGAADMQEEAHRLAKWLFSNAWDDSACWYCDVDRLGVCTGIKSAAGWWAILALVEYKKWCTFAKQASQIDFTEQNDRAACMAAHLSSPDTFGRKHLVPSLSADSAGYSGTAGYWRGGVWPPTTYLAVLACNAYRLEAASDQITASHLACCVEVFAETGSIWENYAPDSVQPGDPARRDFVGWGGLGPIALLLQEVCGVTWDAALRQLCIAPRHSQGVEIKGLHCVAADAVYACDIEIQPAPSSGAISVQRVRRVDMRVLEARDESAAAAAFQYTIA